MSEKDLLKSAVVEAEVPEVITAALMQDGIPLVRNLRVGNRTEKAFADVVCAISSDDGLVVPGKVSFREVPANGEAVRAYVGVQLNPRRLEEVGEGSAQSSLKLVVSAAGEVICERIYPVMVGSGGAADAQPTESRAGVAQTAQGRIDRWTQKLLDFSARNRLLNIPASSRQVIPLVCSDLGALENQIAANRTITIRSAEDALGEKTFADLQANRLTTEQCKDTIDAELRSGRLCAMMPPREVYRRLSDLYHDARTNLEESGVNTLFLAIGALQWMDPSAGKNRKAYRAPILMVPVRLERASMAEGVKMSRIDEETTINSTLIEFLRTQFTITVPGLDPLPADDYGVDVRSVLDAFRQSIKKMEGWEVVDDVHIGCFSFGKFVMWKDMTDRVDELKKNSLVNHLIGGGGLFDDGIEVFPAEEVARHVNPEKLYCPVSYDSSQLAAVLYSELGKSFVLHGPPGTGKAQTITNIIAHNLALGRRVLFVSEKKAALDVVKARLDRIGLTPFCLELHSNKTEKGKFYEQIKAALSVPDTVAPNEWGQVVADFERNRAELNAYVAELHRPYPNGLSAYNCFTRAIQYGSKVSQELFAFDCLKQDCESYREARQTVQDLLTDFRGVLETALKAMPELKVESWSPVLERQFKEAAQDMATTSAGLKTPPGALYGMLRDLDRREELAKLLDGYALDRLSEFSLDGVAGMLADNARAFVLVRLIKNLILFQEVKGMFLPGTAKPSAEKLAADIPLLKEYREIVARLGTADVAEVGVKRQELAAKFKALAEFVVLDALPMTEVTTPDFFQAMADGCGDLRNVLRYRKTLARAKTLGVGAFADYILANDDGTLDILAVFDDAYAAKMLDAVLAQTPVLAEFTGVGQEERVERFRQLDERYMELTKRVVFAKLAETLPRGRGGSCPDGSELGVVKRECEKKTRQKAVRQILAESKTLIPAMKPCFLMSPLSVAQYLPVDSRPFDLIVFDEASQIPVWDAIGVIARGKQLVVVGDPKQMPPTSFFQKGETEDEDMEDESIADQESILDECLVAGVHSTYLSWHYRSRHEALIAFSNEHYYDGKLCTFPAAANSPRLGVKFVFVEGGVFERQGKGPRTNPIEAKALVDYICSEVRKPGYKRRSIGVVTFSMPQQKLIRTMLDERRGGDPVLEKLLPDDGEGAYFVKNLENVQGDESDVILFSVGYAPDEAGRFTMYFCPLNLSGGERRLNVAVTRAKEQVVVFSSIRSAQIDAGEGGRTRAVGAGHLKAFLEYAERGNAVASGAGSVVSDDFGGVLASFLAEHGYHVDRNVGCSEFRIDVAVSDPSDPQRYLMGIECDGPSYAGQRTALDRDVNRVGVLKGLGWHMYRAWSVDWAFDRKRAEERLLQALERAGRNESLPPPPLPKPEPEVVEAKPSTGPAAVLRETYRCWRPSGAKPSRKLDDDASQKRVAEMLAQAIEVEGPICGDLLFRRVAGAWGVTRITDAVRRVLDFCSPSSSAITVECGVTVYWPAGMKSADYRGFRVPAKEKDPSTKRALEEIPPQEVANAMDELIIEFGDCPQDVLFRETLKLFGLGALTDKARGRLAACEALRRG